MNHEVDLLGLDDGFNVVRLSGASALQDLEVSTAILNAYTRSANT